MYENTTKNTYNNNEIDQRAHDVFSTALFSF